MVSKKQTKKYAELFFELEGGGGRQKRGGRKVAARLGILPLFLSFSLVFVGGSAFPRELFCRTSKKFFIKFGFLVFFFHTLIFTWC